MVSLFLDGKTVNTGGGAAVVAKILVCILATSVDIGFQIEHIHVRYAAILRFIGGEDRNNHWMRQMVWKKFSDNYG